MHVLKLKSIGWNSTMEIILTITKKTFLFTLKYLFNRYLISVIHNAFTYYRENIKMVVKFKVLIDF